MTNAGVPEPINSRVQQAGWIPIEQLGEGGGGKVFLCVKAELIQTVEGLMGQGAVKDPAKVFAVSSKLIRELNTSLVTERNALAALKIPQALEDPATRERLKREIDAMRVVHHPSLIRLFGFDQESSPEWFVMELHGQGNLSDSVARYSRRIVKTLESILPIAAGVKLLHDEGYVHRDIKPNNIFVSDNGDLVLGDLGIVFPGHQKGERLTESGMTLFSRDWIPDWIRFTDTPPQPKIDVFMLGKVIYFMVTGGQKVLASQLDEDTFNLENLLKGQEGAAELQKFLIDCITTKEKDCKFENAGTFLIRLRELLNQLTGRSQENLLFSFLSVHSTTHIPIQRGFVSENPRYPSLTRLQIFFPTKHKTLCARARLSGPPRSEQFVLFLMIDGVHQTTSNGFGIELTPDSDDRGTWTQEIRVTLSTPMDRGWHNADIIIISDSASYALTGFMLYGR